MPFVEPSREVLPRFPEGIPYRMPARTGGEVFLQDVIPWLVLIVLALMAGSLAYRYRHSLWNWLIGSLALGLRGARLGDKAAKSLAEQVRHRADQAK